MEAKKLKKKVEDWALGLGFTLPDNLLTSQNFFSLLVATPHRRQLWNTIIDSVQTKNTVELMRKQLLVAKLKDLSYGNRSVTSRLDTWKKQNSLERLFKQKRDLVLKQENEIFTIASDLLFKICSLSNLENQCEEFKERTLVLYLFSRKEKRFVEELENYLLSIVQHSLNNNQRPENIQERVANLKNCFTSDCEGSDCNNCAMTTELEEITNTGISEETLLEKVVICKRSVLEKLEKFLEQFNTEVKENARENEKEIQKKFCTLITQLKQMVSEKSLQALLNVTEGELLDLESQRLQNLLLGFQENSFICDASIFSQEDINKTNVAKENAFSAIKRHINVSAMTSYKKYLEDFLETQESLEKNDEKKTKKEFREPAEAISMTCNEIHRRNLELKEQSKVLLRKYEKYETLIRETRNRVKNESFVAGVEKAVATLKTSGDRQIELFITIPLEAFQMLDRPTESEAQGYVQPYSFITYGVEFKKIFSTMLTSPFLTFDAFLQEVDKRTKLIEDTQKFITEREKLSEWLRKIHSTLVSIKCDRHTCETNFKDLEKILENFLCKVDEIEKKIEFARQGLKNWVEQPYKLMLKESTMEGLNFKNYEENCSKK